MSIIEKRDTSIEKIVARTLEVRANFQKAEYVHLLQLKRKIQRTLETSKSLLEGIQIPPTLSMQLIWPSGDYLGDQRQVIIRRASTLLFDTICAIDVLQKEIEETEKESGTGYLGGWKNALRYIKLADHLLSEYKGLRDVKGIERETILSEAKILDHKPAVLDVGCGIGSDIKFLRARIDGYFYGIDNNLLAIHECNAKINGTFLHMDARKMFFADDYFDISYVTVNTLGNLNAENRLAWIREMLRVSSGDILATFYINTQDYQKMRIADRIDYYTRATEGRRTIFDGKQFQIPSLGWTGRLFTMPELKEMFERFGIKNYEIKFLNEIMTIVKIPKT
ncbi:MAG: class I SAM-dependent methyltransferase [Candidatus Micrarchaeota archaeon]